MAQGPLSIQFTPEARVDWIAIWHWNATTYGERRADKYISFLESEIQRIASQPTIGTLVPEVPGLRRHLAKRRARGHGHIIFYRIVDEQLQVIHIFHTAQDWRGWLNPLG
ncbi:MAG: type II toxin-antitoxin system RelE/ParE family toxin [Fimbriimonadaceae bacterium]